MTRSFFSYFALLFLIFSSLSVLSQNKMIPFPIDWEGLTEAEFNLSFLLDKPAGKDGFIKIENGHFVKPGGERFRIWGVNLTGGACFPEKPDAPKVAAFLAAMGINAVRFHFLDSNWGEERSIFDYSKNNTSEFNPEQLDKLDFFVAELKKQGIYSNFNLNVGRNFREGDKVPFYEYLGLAKGATLFDDRLIQLQKEYAAKLLTHENTYTGNEYRNEPALAFIEIVNENSLVEAWFSGRLNGDHDTKETSTWSGIPKFYADELTLKYNGWLRSAIPPDRIYRIREEIGIDANALIPRLKHNEFGNASDLRFQTEARFIMYTENAFYYGMYKYLKETIKAGQLIAANSDHNHYKSGYALLLSTSKLDFVDGHVYWQHPNYFTDPDTGERSFKIDNTPMVNEPAWSTVAQLSRSAVAGKPYTVSETNHPYPNRFACEGFVTLGAYALFQDWDGIYFYTFEHSDPVEWKTKRPNYFDILHDPVKMANLAPGALMFHRADVKPAETTVMRYYKTQEIIEGIRKNFGEKPFFTPGFDMSTPLKAATRLQFNSLKENNFTPATESYKILSETGELLWDTTEDNGLIKINTTKTQALIGFVSKMDTVQTQNLKVDLNNNFASVVLSSLDGKSLDSAKRMLLSVTSSSLLYGAKFNATGTSLEEWGELPFTILPVTGNIEIHNSAISDKAEIKVLNGAGQVTESFPATLTNQNAFRFELPEIPTVWYLIELN